MTKKFDNELLSGYLDRELNPDQQADIAARLADSESLQRDFAELEKLSELLQDLPAEPAPADMKQQVLSQVPTSKVPTASPRGGWTGFVAMLTAAAALLLMLRYFGDDAAEPGRSNIASDAVSMTSPAEEAGELEGAMEMDAAVPAMPAAPGAGFSGGASPIAEASKRAAPPAASADRSPAAPLMEKASPESRLLAEIRKGEDFALIRVGGAPRDVRARLERALTLESFQAAAPTTAAVGAGSGPPVPGGLEAIVVQVDHARLAQVLGRVQSEVGGTTLNIDRSADLQDRFRAALDLDLAQQNFAQVAAATADAGRPESRMRAAVPGKGAAATSQSTVEQKKTAGREAADAVTKVADADEVTRAVRLIFVMQATVEPAEPAPSPCADGAA